MSAITDHPKDYAAWARLYVKLGNVEQARRNATVAARRYRRTVAYYRS